MSRIVLAVLMFLLPAMMFAQSLSTGSAYQPATIVDVKLCQSSTSTDSGGALYEVSLKVKQTVYVVLVPPPDGSGTIIYAPGREILVLVGDDKIIWNDILGHSHEARIITRTLIASPSTAQN